jgi:hypothetical protein
MYLIRSDVGVPGPNSLPVPCATGQEHVLAPGGVEQFAHAREQSHVRAREDRKADDVDVLLNRGLRDHLGGLMEPRVDHFHPGVTQGRGHHFRAAIVAVQARLGHQDPDRPLGGRSLLGHQERKRSSAARPSTTRRARSS